MDFYQMTAFDLGWRVVFYGVLFAAAVKILAL
jgi:hypothetical protein